MENISAPWRRCPSCEHGQIILFTSAKPCHNCLATGIDFSDARLTVPLNSLHCMVRTYKFLHRQGVDTLGQLVAFAAEGRLSRFAETNPGTVADARKLLQSFNLPTD